ncbi:hypothetical protein C5167_015656 [Papaver somniferum]|uniref:HAT C-terminal dimerisation domain-containing protein n=1 Tax=Papaver somniferum TaxID=3469 RepID=A0A4Y7JB08_PAPSO|nr:hypothetical protein C5167_015656 [Papaver somniferum]
MAANEVTARVHDHCTVVEKVNNRVTLTCNYCGKIVSCYSRLKKHLAGTGGDVSPCIDVPENIKVQMRNSLPMNREVLQLFKSCSLSKKTSDSSDSLERSSNNVDESIQSNLSRKRKHSSIIEYSGLEHEVEVLQVVHYPEILNKMKKEEQGAEDDSSTQIQRCIGKFFFENGVDFTAANSPSFKKMIHALGGPASTAYKVPNCDDLKGASGAFGNADAVDQRMKLAPAKWWSLYGGQCPELQRLAIRILSQTCTGALRYGLKRSLTEELHMKGRNRVEQKRLNELTFVYHNLRLQNLSAPNTDNTDVFLEPMDSMDEWVGGGSMEEKAVEQNGNANNSWMFSS